METTDIPGNLRPADEASQSNDVNLWDDLADHFDAGTPEVLPWDVADNIEIAQPVVLTLLSEIDASESLRVLDFGCGSGQFAERLSEQGYRVDGLDASQGMIEAAKRRQLKSVVFRTGTSADLAACTPYDAIVSIMTLQFIGNADLTIAELSQAVKPTGIVILVVHNPQFVADWAQIPYRYVDFATPTDPTRGALEFGDVKVPLYIRTASKYRQIAGGYGLTCFHESYPPFTASFLHKYSVDGPTTHSEYCVLAFRRQQPATSSSNG